MFYSDALDNFLLGGNHVEYLGGTNEKKHAQGVEHNFQVSMDYFVLKKSKKNKPMLHFKPISMFFLCAYDGDLFWLLCQQILK